MPRLTPAQRFHNIFKQWTTGATEAVRATGEKKMDEWLARNNKTRADIAALLAEAHADDLKANPPPPPPDPRNNTSVQFDPERHNPASLVEGIIKTYVTATEHTRVVYSLWVVLSHVYTRFSIAPRLVLASKVPGCGKSILVAIARHLTCRPNDEAVGTGAAIEDHFVLGLPGTVLLDEIEYSGADDSKRLQRVWNIGFQEPNSKISKVVKGRKELISLFALALLAGVNRGVGRLLARQQQSRTFRLELQKYTAETMPPRDFYVPEDVDREALIAVYSLLCGWVPNAKLNPKPPMPPGVIGRDADTIRGLLSVADACGGEWPRRAREALTVLLELRKAESPESVFLRHGIAILDALGVEQMDVTAFDKALRELDLPEMDWKRYRGLDGNEYEHPITAHERAELLGRPSQTIRPGGGGKPFRGLKRAWFVAAQREHESEDTESVPRLKLILSKGNE